MFSGESLAIWDASRGPDHAVIPVVRSHHPSARISSSRASMPVVRRSRANPLSSDRWSRKPRHPVPGPGRPDVGWSESGA